MEAADDRRYRQFLARDPSCDGKFLTGVLTTGIYCLPSCPAKRPHRENVRFFKTPDDARRSGLRPCRRCHPDWFYRGEDWHETLYEQTAARVRQTPAAFPDIGALASTAGLSRTALNDLFREHAHESPGSFLKRVRIAHACSLLEKGEKPGSAAAAAGFESASSFHERFLAQTGLTPGVYASLADSREFTLRLPLGFRPQEVLDFYGRDPLSVSEQVFESGLRKALLINGKPALIEISFRENFALCRIEGGNPYDAHRAIVRMLGIDSDASQFERQFADDPLLGALLSTQRGLRIPLTPQPWEALTWAVIGQQISLKAAVALRRELIGATGMPHASGLRAHPSPAAVATLDVETLRKLKFSTSKAEYLIAAARSVSSGELPLADLRDLSARHAARLLGKVRGIGPWTVQYVFLRGFGFADSLPSSDAGLAQGLGRLCAERPVEKQIKEMMLRFAPWRSLATYHIWVSLKGTESHAV